MNLHLKYRPSSFDDVMGNEKIVETLKGMLSGNGEAPHAILLHGPTGCGKTTLGRIIANTLGSVGNDLREIDSADFRGIDSVRDIRKQSRFKSLEGNVRVWILDECHKMTNDAQNALLKALEDTPPHVYYILCTTDPQKLIAAIRGRCAQFQVSPLSDRDMKKLLVSVVKSEGESIEKEIYEQIVLDSQGLPRNALQILAQVLAVIPENRLEVARQAAELQSQTIELCRALIGRPNWKGIQNILNGLKDQEPEGIRRAVMGYCSAVLLKSGQNDQVAKTLEAFLEPTYDTGFPGIVFACYSALFG